MEKFENFKRSFLDFANSYLVLPLNASIMDDDDELLLGAGIAAAVVSVIVTRTIAARKRKHCSFFTLIFAVLLVGANFYMRPEYLTITISNLNFNFPPLIVHR